MLVLLHDFPEFLSEYYFTLCDAVPSSCIQLRNIILSAFPSTIVLPDPYLMDGVCDTVPEMGPIPPILSDFTAGLKGGDMHSYLDQYLLGRASSSSLPSLKSRLRAPTSDDASEAYDVPFLNALVMYVGVSSVAQAKAKSGSSIFNASDPGVMALRYLAKNLDPEGAFNCTYGMTFSLTTRQANIYC